MVDGASRARKGAPKRCYVIGSRHVAAKKPIRATPASVTSQAVPEPAVVGRYANVRRGSAALGEVPPFCFLVTCRTVDEALRAAVKAMGLSHPVDVVVLAWHLRKVAEGRAS